MLKDKGSKPTRAQKPAAKKTVKSAAPKPRAVKPKAVRPKQVVSNVPEEYVFWCHNGGIYRNLMDLRDALSIMPDDIYFYHANAERNDFANWVRDIIEDAALAAALSSCSCRDDAAREVAIRVTEME